MQVQIEFTYQGQSTFIQGNTQDMLNETFQKFANKVQIDINTVYFLYSGNIIDGNSTIAQKINSTDKERKMMVILVYNRYEMNQNTVIIKPKEISCPKCGDIAKINIVDYKILLQCKNGHNRGNILLDEFKNTQKIDISKIKCDVCNINNKSNTYKNILFRCSICNINICPLCVDKHEKNHKIINYDDKNYICYKHNKIYNSYCDTCKNNICLFCEKEHKDNKHKIINYIELLPNINKVNDNIKEIKNKIDIFNNIIDDIIKKLKKVKENIEYYYNINIDIINLLNNNNINYEILYNYNKIKDIEIINDINKIINNNENINNILNIYKKMINKYNDKIIINYKIQDKIKLFGYDFIINNKDNCKMIIEDKEYELKEYFESKNLKNKNILIVELKGISNITNMSWMFYKCSSLTSLPNINNWNTANVTNMNHMLSECSSLTSLPNINNWNTANVTDMICMFYGCSKLKNIPKKFIK